MAGLLLVAYGPSALPRTGWAGVPSERAIFFIPRKKLISRPVEQGFNERFENNLPQKFTSKALCGCSGRYNNKDWKIVKQIVQEDMQREHKLRKNNGKK
jgi:hypothetical protein